MSAIGSAITIVASIAQASESRRAGKAQRAQYAAEQRKAQIENVYKARQSIRQARIAQASMTNQAALSGGIGGSGLAGGLSSVGSQLAGNLSYMSDIAEENTAISNFAITGAKAQSNAAVWGQVGKISSTIFSGMTGASFGEQVGQQLAKKTGP